MIFDESALSRRAMLGSILGVSAVACVAAPKTLTLAEIVRRNTRARGGAAALDRVRAVSINVELIEGGQTITGPYSANVEGLVRVDIYSGGKNVYAEGVDRAGVWRWTGGPEPARPSTAVGAANALTNGAEQHLFGWHRFAERGHKMALMPQALIDGVLHQVVEVHFSTGQISYFYVDPISWQAVRRRDERAYHPDNDQTKQRIESRFFDFVGVDGVVASHRSQDVDLATGKTLASSRVLERRINPQLAADYFDRDRRAPATRA
jgi:hypothetical protein